MGRWFRNSWFLLTLVTLLATGVAAAPILGPLASNVPRLWLVAAIMFVTALPIDLRAVAKSRGAGRAVGLAVGLNAILAPLCASLGGWVLPTEFANGLIIAAAAPCTIASAAVWTRRGNGNDGVVVMVTLLTTLGCFVVMPFWTRLFIGESVGSEGFYVRLIMKLLACVVAPVLLAQAARSIPAFNHRATAAKPALSLAAQFGVLTVALLGAIDSGQRLRAMDEPIAGVDWVLVVVTAAAVHTAVLLAGWRTAGLAGLARPEAIAVAISGSQKTLAVGVAIALEFGGLAIFPMIAYHMTQLLIDTVFVDRVRA